MTEYQHNRPGRGPTDAEKDLAEHERPDVGLVGDEDLPEDLRPTDDNPLAQDDDSDEPGRRSAGAAPDSVEGTPDMGAPGGPA
jgi:hypothetical protein